MSNKQKRKEERKQKRLIHRYQMYQGDRIHVATWCVFTVWLIILILLVMLLVYVRTGNYSIW